MMASDSKLVPSKIPEPADQQIHQGDDGAAIAEPGQRGQDHRSASDDVSITTAEEQAVSTMILALNNREPSITFDAPPCAPINAGTNEGEGSAATTAVVPVNSTAVEESCKKPMDSHETNPSTKKATKEEKKRSKGGTTSGSRKKETKSKSRRSKTRTMPDSSYEENSLDSDSEDLLDTFLDLLWSEEGDDYESAWSQDERTSRRKRPQKQSSKVSKESLKDKDTSVDNPELQVNAAETSAETSAETEQDFLTELSTALSFGDDNSAAKVGEQVISGISAAIRVIEEDDNVPENGLPDPNNAETKSTEISAPGLLANDQLKGVSDPRSLAQPLQDDNSADKASTNETTAKVPNADSSVSGSSIRGHVETTVRPIKDPAPYLGSKGPGDPSTASAANKKPSVSENYTTRLNDALSQAKASFQKISSNFQGNKNQGDVPGTAETELEKMVVAFQQLITCNKSALPSQKDGSENESFLSTLSKSFSFWKGEATEKSDTASPAAETVTNELSEIPEQEEDGQTPEVLSTPERLKRSQRVLEAKDAPSKTLFSTPQKSSATDTSSPTTVPHAMMTSDSPTSVQSELNLSDSFNIPTANSTDTWEAFDQTQDFDKHTDAFQVTYKNQSSRWLRKAQSSPSAEKLSGYAESVPEFEDFRRQSLQAMLGSTHAEF